MRLVQIVKVIVVVLVTCLSSILYAQQPSISATVSHRSFEEGDSARIIISVFGGKPEIELPLKIEAEGLSINFMDKSYVYPEHFYYYRVSGNNAGEYKIPAIEAIVGGKTVRSVPMAVHIRPRSRLDTNAAPRFGLIRTPKSGLYVNQKFALEAGLYVKGQNAFVGSGITNAALDHEKFVIKPFGQLDLGREEIEGRFYSTGKVPTTLFGLKPGVHKLGPVVFDARVYIDNGRLMGRSPSNISIESETVDIEILPLPKGAPASFTGGVGEFVLESSAEPLNLQTGDPISVTFSIVGVGNFETMSAPVMTERDETTWKLYKPRKEIKVVSDGILPGKVVFTQVMVPMVKTESLPMFKLSYFSPDTKSYVSQNTPTRKIVVTQAKDLGINEILPPNRFIGQTQPDLPVDVAFIEKFDVATPERLDTGLSRWLFIGMNVLLGVMFAVFLFGGIARRIRRKKLQNLTLKPLSFKEASHLVSVGLSRNDFFHNALAAFRIWEQEHQDAPQEALDLVKKMRQKCENALYSETGDHSENLISTSEASEYIKVLRIIPVR